MTAAHNKTTRERNAGESAEAGRGKIAGPLKSIASMIALGLLTLATQIALRRELAPGEFGTLNALFGVVLVLIAPLAALGFVLRRAVPEGEIGPLLNRIAPAWGIVCLVALFVIFPPLQIPRVSLQFYTLLAVGAGLLAICGRPATAARWCAIVGISAAVLRLLVSAWAARNWPVAESGLGALVLGGALAGLPALRDQPAPRALREIWRELRPGLVPALAAISLAASLALFTNADRIAAQPLLGTPDPGQYVNLRLAEINGYRFSPADPAGSYVDYLQFDDYEAVGLCGRGLLIVLFPALLVLLRQRTSLDRTTIKSLRWFWIYLGLLFMGTVALVFAAPLIAFLFHAPTDLPPGPLHEPIATIVPGFAAAFFFIGLLHAVGIFALASRRHVECFLLGICSLGYTGFLFHASRRAELLTACMVGGALTTLALVLLVGVVRYARSHP
jgi:hypothetical protein